MRAFTRGDFFRERHQSRRMAMLDSDIASVPVMAPIGIRPKAMSVGTPEFTLESGPELTTIEQAENAPALRRKNLAIPAATGEFASSELAEIESPRPENPRREFSRLNESWLV